MTSRTARVAAALCLVLAALPPAGAEPTVEAMAAQMLMVGFRSTESPIVHHIEAGSVGNVILFSRDLTNGAGTDRNIRSTEQLGALTQRHGLEERILLSVSAGSDLLSFAQNMKGMDFDPDFPKKAHEPLARLVREGRIPEERLRRSWDRIAAMKRKRR